MKKALSVFLAVTIVGLSCMPMAGCAGGTIQTLLADLPVAADIALSVVNIVTPGDAANVQQVTEYAGKAGSDLKLLESLIHQYQSNLAAAPGGALAQINAALNDCRTNLAAMLTAVGVNDPKITSAVSAAVASVQLILNDAALLVQNSAPPAVTAKMFFGLGIPGADFMAISDKPVQPPAGAKASAARLSGKSARQIAREYNRKIGDDFPRAKVTVPRLQMFGIALPLTGR